MIQLEKQAARKHPISQDVTRPRKSSKEEEGLIAISGTMASWKAFSSQSLDSHSCETVATDPAYQSSAAYSNGTKPRFLWIQS